MEKKINLEKLKENEIFRTMIEANLIDENGIRTAGIGVLIGKMDKLAELIDKTNIRLWGLGKEIEKLRNK